MNPDLLLHRFPAALALLAVVLHGAPAMGLLPFPVAAQGESAAADSGVAVEGTIEADLEPDFDLDPDSDLDFELEDWLEDEPPDPMEPGNRIVFRFNDRLYRFVFNPISDAWEFAVPKPVRKSVRQFFSNLREPANFVNEVLQLRGRAARDTGARFLVNSTVGVAGLFDPAQSWGLEPYNTDFGQTLALYGVQDGAYVVIPVMGPANLRDAVGQIVDVAMRPDLWLLAPGPQLVFVTSNGLVGYETRRVHLNELRNGSFDFYAAMRSAYRMDRAAQIQELRELKNGTPETPGKEGPADEESGLEAPPSGEGMNPGL